MKPFKFRAAAALGLRRERDRDAQRRLALADTVVRSTEAARLRAYAARDGVRADIAGRMRKGVESGLLEWYRNWMLLSERTVVESERVVERARAERHTAQTAAVHARRDLRALETLRDRCWRRYVQAVDRAEQRELDALAVQQFVARERARKDDA